MSVIFASFRSLQLSVQPHRSYPGGPAGQLDIPPNDRAATQDNDPEQAQFPVNNHEGLYSVQIKLNFHRRAYK